MLFIGTKWKQAEWQQSQAPRCQDGRDRRHERSSPTARPRSTALKWPPSTAEFEATGFSREIWAHVLCFFKSILKLNLWDRFCLFKCEKMPFLNYCKGNNSVITLKILFLLLSLFLLIPPRVDRGEQKLAEILWEGLFQQKIHACMHTYTHHGNKSGWFNYISSTIKKIY